MAARLRKRLCGAALWAQFYPLSMRSCVFCNRQNGNKQLEQGTCSETVGTLFVRNEWRPARLALNGSAQ
jgi:hypothetical protein